MLEFTGRDSAKGARLGKDVTLTIRKGNAVGITVRNDKAQLISRVNGVPHYKFEYAVEGNRLYFRGTSSSKGFSLKPNKNNKAQNYYANIAAKYQTADFALFVATYEGDYELHYDADINLYYIECGIVFHGRN